MVAAGVAVITLLVGVMKFMSAQVEAKLAQRDAEQDKRLESQASDIETLKTTLADTRTELHRDYVHRDTLTEFQHKLDRDMESIFKRLEGLSKDLNQIIGRLDRQVNDGEPR